MSKTIKMICSNGDSWSGSDEGEAIIYRAIKRSQGLKVRRYVKYVD